MTAQNWKYFGKSLKNLYTKKDVEWKDLSKSKILS